MGVLGLLQVTIVSEGNAQAARQTLFQGVMQVARQSPIERRIRQPVRPDQAEFPRDFPKD